MNRSKLMETYPNKKFVGTHIIKTDYVEKKVQDTLISRLNYDIFEIIKGKSDKFYKKYYEDVYFDYNTLKKRIASLIVLLYNKLDAFCDSDRNADYIYHVDKNKFDPEKDFRIIYNVLFELFEKYQQRLFTINRVTIGKRRPYFIYECLYRRYSNVTISYILVYCQKDPNKKYYDIYLRKFETLEEAKEEVKQNIKIVSETGSIRSFSVEKSPN